MGYFDVTYAQNWIEQLRRNHEELHPQRDALARMTRVVEWGANVFPWEESVQGYDLWKKRDWCIKTSIIKLMR